MEMSNLGPLNGQNRIGIAFKMILLDLEMRFKKISSKNIFSSWRKIILKKTNPDFPQTFSNFSRSQIAHFPKKPTQYEDLHPLKKNNS